MNISKEDRERIVREHAKRNGGKFNPAVFRDEVERAGAEHPAYAWFTWDESEAARKHQIWEARMFAQGIKIQFTIETIGKDRVIEVREMEAPLAISPMEERRHDGGYFVFNPKSKQHQAELCQQAARDLTAWLIRYNFALAHVGMDESSVRTIISRLETGKKESKAKPKPKQTPVHAIA